MMLLCGLPTKPLMMKASGFRARLKSHGTRTMLPTKSGSESSLGCILNSRLVSALQTCLCLSSALRKDADFPAQSAVQFATTTSYAGYRARRDPNESRFGNFKSPFMVFSLIQALSMPTAMLVSRNACVRGCAPNALPKKSSGPSLNDALKTPLSLYLALRPLPVPSLPVRPNVPHRAGRSVQGPPD